MFNQWSMEYDKKTGVWSRKIISHEGIEHHYIHNNNTIITKNPSEIAKEWARDPRPLIEAYLKQKIGRPIVATIDVMRKTMIITHIKNNTTYTLYYSKNLPPMEIPDREPLIGVPCPPKKGFKELPDSPHTQVKKGKGHLIVKQCTPSRKILALWRPGTLITSTSPPNHEPPQPEWEWAFTNKKKWIREENTIRVSTHTPYVNPPDGIEPTFSIKTPIFSVYHDHTGVDWVVTPRTVEKIETRAKNVEELFRKIFTGKYRIL